MKIYLATDHAGFDVKEYIKHFLIEEGHDVEDCGAFVFDKNDDYPDLIKIAAQKVSQNATSIGIIFGKSGAGEVIVANKIKGIRAILAFSEENVVLAREHNNANIISIGSQFVTRGKAKELIKIFLTTNFTNEKRHLRRIEKIQQIENE